MRWRRATLVALLAVLVAGTFLRIHWNDVYEYSTADETIYRDYARFLASSGWGAYPILVAAYLATPPVWTSPPPLRYGHFAIISAVCAAARQCEYRTLAWVSTVAGIAMILVTYAIGRHFFGEPIGLLAAALVVTSPLQLGLGRRALQDELAALFAVAAAAALLWARDAAPVRWMTALRTTAAVLLGAAALAVKESYLIFYPGLVAAYAVGIRTRGIRWRDGLLFVAPPLLYVTGFVASSRSLASFFAAARTLVGSIPGNEYVLAYEAGPPHRPLFDLFVLSPLVCLAAVAAVTLVLGHRDEAAPGPKRFSALVVGLFIVYALVSKNLRYSVAADTLVRILAAWALWVYLLPRRRLAPAAVVFVLASGLAEILVFRAIFVLGGVYDPVTLVLLRGLGAIPRGPILP